MRYSASAVLAALSFALVSCTDANTPITQEQADEALATSLSGVGVDPNAETAGGHTATPPSVTCTWDASTNWTTCASTQNGLTVTRQMQFLTGAGTPQQRPDSNTRTMNSKTAIAGTISITSQMTGGPTGTTTVNRVSTESVTGLGPSSTQRVVNGTATGTEDSQGTDSRGTMSVKRTYTDTTKDMTLTSPPNPTAPYPVSGTVIRNVTAKVAINDGAAKDYTSREVQTFEAGGKLTVTTTMNGKTRTCVIQLGTKTAPVCTQG